MEFSASEGSSLYIHFPDPYSMQGFISSNVSKKRKNIFFYLNKKQNSTSIMSFSLEFVGYGAFSQSTSIFIKCENSH